MEFLWNLFYSSKILKLYSCPYLVQVPNNLDNINIVSDINGNTVGWTLGYLINQLNRDEFLPFESPPRRLSRDFFIPAITVASAFTVFFLFLFVFYLFRFNFKKERNYF